MESKNEKIERWIENLTPEAKDQALRFLLYPNTPIETSDNKGFILLQIEEFVRMFRI